jgi:hypothetical protein
MATTRQQSNRLLLRARDAIDRDFVGPLDIGELARIALCSEAIPHVPTCWTLRMLAEGRTR